MVKIHKIDTGNAVRAIARERIGSPKPKRVIVSKKQKPAKHKARDEEGE